ncbi:unnamed protein product [Toxocara canis]|uniref:Phosphoenolpyruvate carboxykinase (ATP) n=1 Tax=Toxocara canis TaxID=6265 RepID=A0A183US48_TOXCA|nr:unnamed protein product [Toxocara canis]
MRHFFTRPPVAAFGPLTRALKAPLQDVKIDSGLIQRPKYLPIISERSTEQFPGVKSASRESLVHGFHSAVKIQPSDPTGNN